VERLEKKLRGERVSDFVGDFLVNEFAERGLDVGVGFQVEGDHVVVEIREPESYSRIRSEAEWTLEQACEKAVETLGRDDVEVCHLDMAGKQLGDLATQAFSILAENEVIELGYNSVEAFIRDRKGYLTLADVSGVAWGGGNAQLVLSNTRRRDRNIGITEAYVKHGYGTGILRGRLEEQLVGEEKRDFNVAMTKIVHRGLEKAGANPGRIRFGFTGNNSLRASIAKELPNA
jgi:hypothetical protein